MEQKQKMNKIGTEPVNRLMLAMGMPMILSMVLQAVYNIVDSAFVANMQNNGEAALNALTLAFPVQMMMVAVGIGTGVGVNALLSKSLGQNNPEKVNKAAGNAVFLGVVIFILFLMFGLFGIRAYVGSQTGNPLIANMAEDYLRICCCTSIGIVFFSIYEKLLQAAGHSIYSTIAQIAGAVTNMVLDPIMIYGFWGCPEMGVKGAAYATVTGQCVSMLMALIFHLKVNKDVSNNIRYIRPSAQIIKEIYSIGLPAIIAQALMSVMTYGMNIILGGIGEAAVTAYGLYYKIQQFVLFAAFGLRDAITPIVSFNHGMQSRTRILEGIKYGIGYTLCIMAAGLLVLELFAEPFSGIFGLSGTTQDLCISAMRIISVSFLFAGANIAFQGIFQALDGGIESLVISVCRQCLFVLPAAWLFARMVRSSGADSWIVWLSVPMAEILSAAISCLLMKRIYKQKIAGMNTEEDKKVPEQGRTQYEA
ncbi:MATE family efflux transporter [Anaerostipes sp.]|uniref:MATE family efflux transporter n=1 Tax=Anaerostipes sp. TaxID=1872530 RepID=UPI0025BD459D|nr:MATE family efflux transporter [Anaerostipes sp.]MBS7009896.1 MATE family efflux transporter [Anaerostipes sp.]